jgi:Fe-S cluster assembly ATP-binding protein
MLEIEKLTVAVESKEVVKGVSLTVNAGEVHAIMGPNGSGKSSVCYGLLGHPKYKAHGSAKLDGKELLTLKPDERARLGMFLAFQNPQAISGVNVTNILRKAVGGGASGKEKLDAMVKVNEQVLAGVKEMELPDESGKRDLNVGFSGGEKKRMEMLQLKVLAPKIAILDEIESGLDVDGVKKVAAAINSMRDGKRAFILITHFPRILEHVKPDRVHVMVEGKIVRSGNQDLAKEIEKKGYEQFKTKGKKTAD